MKYFGSAIIGLVASIALTTGASAAIVCNDEGDCWQVKERHKYPPEVDVQIYDDDWRWPEGAKSRWREPGVGRGYWRRGVWVGF